MRLFTLVINPPYTVVLSESMKSAVQCTVTTACNNKLYIFRVNFPRYVFPSVRSDVGIVSSDRLGTGTRDRE